jgi:hypothetical protein
MSRLKTVYFFDTQWSLPEAISWMKSHKVKYTKVRHEGSQWRFVVRPKGEFSHFITKIIQSKFISGEIRNVYFVIGFP